ncbi:ATP-binding protein [candidate division KSB1 bacterium]|nr:ATP-binding protein [candidate division KSB1 bacterium]NIU27507.1 ATP-binding protein [candidate division KSB1 bacterium]NIW71906.1 hypothetical protein [candidate division KSB1 bacterium]
MIYTIERCGNLNERLRAPKKLYSADVGIRNHLTGFCDKVAIFENLTYLKIKQNKPCYIYRGGLEIDFYFDETIMEAKLNKQLEGRQKTFFDNFKAKEKMILQGLNDYLNLSFCI